MCISNSVDCNYPVTVEVEKGSFHMGRSPLSDVMLNTTSCLVAGNFHILSNGIPNGSLTKKNPALYAPQRLFRDLRLCGPNLHLSGLFCDVKKCLSGDRRLGPILQIFRGSIFEGEACSLGVSGSGSFK